MSDSGTVKVSIEDGLCHIVLDRPERKNALSLSMYQQLGDAVRNASASEAVKVLMLSGKGGSFTSGNDLGDFLKHKGNIPESENPTPKFMRALIDCDKPDA